MKKFLTILLIFSFAFIYAQDDNVIAETSVDKTTTDILPKTDAILAEIVKKALVAAEKTGDFVIEQSPLVLQEFYAWHIWSDIFFIILSILLYFSCRYIPSFFLHKEKKYKNNGSYDREYDVEFFGKYGDELGVVSWVIYIIGTIVALAFLFPSIYDLIYILVAPRLYLIDYFINI